MESGMMPEDVKYIIDTIKKAGYEAYAVGGCIRDMLLGKVPADYDITTSAEPEVVKKLFRRTIDTGIKHGTVTVMLKDKGYEITTYRIDGKYEDGRHPLEVTFTKSLKEDLLRRDFTINAMAYNDEDGLQDPFNGQQDLKDGIIRCVGNPMERFSEDALRMMRAVRFSAQLGYEIEEETLKAVKELAGTISAVSMERIQVEMTKLLTSDNPERLLLAYETGLTGYFLPEFDAMMKTPQNHPHHMYSVGLHTIKSMENVRPDKYLRFAMLLHDSGKPLVKTTGEDGIDHFHGHQSKSGELAVEVLRRLKFDNKTVDIVSKLAKLHDCSIGEDETSIRKAVNKIGEDIFPLLLEVKYGDIMAQSNYLREEKLSKLEAVKAGYREVLSKKDCVSLKSMKITGGDLIAIGYRPGPGLGSELNSLLERVLNNPELNDNEILLNMAKEDLNEKN